MKPALLIVGLGNPGDQYRATRHNVGFRALDVLRESCGGGEWSPAQKFLADVCELTLGEDNVLLVKPTTYMNRSGECIRKLIDFYKLTPATQLLVVVDDIDLPLGTTRLRLEGGPGTHNGMKSIVETLGEHFPRLRIGIGPKPENVDLAAWVLSRLTEEEEKTLAPAFAELRPVVEKIRVARVDSAVD